MTSTRAWHLAVTLAATGLFVPRADAIDVTACGQSVGAGETGVLQADLDCSAAPIGVRLLRRATLDLNGHTITGGDFTYAVVAGVRRATNSNPVGRGRGELAIVGPGVIAGRSYPPRTFPGTEACVLLNNGVAVIGNAELRGCIYGVRGAPIFKGNGNTWTRGPEGRARLELNDTVVAENGSGTAVMTLSATGVTASGNHSMGLGAARDVTVNDVTVTANGLGIFAGALLTGANVTAVGNTINGVDTCGFGHIDLRNLVANDNELFGVCGDSVHLTDSTALNNFLADVAALVSQPVLTNTTCGTSMKQDSSTWGVCAND